MHVHMQVHGFRLALWKEHTNGIFDSFYDPSSLKCATNFYASFNSTITLVLWSVLVSLV